MAPLFSVKACAALFLINSCLPTLEAARSAAQDKALLNFVLNIECLQAEFYSWAAYGHGLSRALRGGGPKSLGGMKANLDEPTQSYAEEFASEGMRHVALLRSVLGADAVPCPQMDIGTAFAVTADAAGGVTLNPPFSPYRNTNSFLLGAFGFEDVTVTAYNGAAPLILDREVLSHATGLMGVAAYHAGVIRSQLSTRSDHAVQPYTGTYVADLADAVAALRGAIGGGKDAGITPADGGDGQVLVPVDDDAVVFSRNTDEVLALVYLGSADVPGGFFPAGLNGAIR